MTITNSTSTHNTTASNSRKIEYIVIHYTAGVTSKSGSAASTASYFKTTSAEVSADFIVDDSTVVQYNPDLANRYCWHCGGSKYSTKGGSFYGKCKNSNSIGIEICSTNSTGTVKNANDSTWSFTDSAVAMAVELTKYLMDKYGIDSEHVIRHYDVTGKLCPGIKGWNADSGSETAWNSFKSQISGTSTTSSTSASNTTTALYRVRKTWSDASSQIGAFSSLENAKAACKSGYSVFDENGNVVYTLSNSTTTTATVPDIIYCVYTSKWLSAVKNTEDYAGVQKTSISGFAAKASNGTLKYRVHIKNGSWLDWVTKYDTSDWSAGCAGIKGKEIDAIQMKLDGVSGYEVKYRVSVTTSSAYLPWVTGTEDYAGILGSSIDCVQAEIVKK